MSNILDEDTRGQLVKILESLVYPVKLVFFTQENACPSCNKQRELLMELASLSDKIEIEIYDFVLHGDQVIRYKIDKIPATAVVGEKDYKIRFYGVTAGYEFTSLVEAIIMVSSGISGLDPQIEKLVADIREQVHLQVLVTVTCPYCPRIVHVANQFALVNENICADMIEAQEFPHLVQRYKVAAVPKTIINEVHSFEGALPSGQVYLEILRTVNPEEYRRLDDVLRENKVARRAGKAEEAHEYDVAIVGGGPAAMSAAIYSARKGLDVVMVTKTLGGQITSTSIVENYLGFPSISGIDIAEAFRNHVESYPIAEALGSEIRQVKKANSIFLTVTVDNREFRAKTIIYCAGKEYTRLGVPGEEQFIGRGIGFCATCDAPLYQGKPVAVVGGGNSAFTAVRDLLDFASEVHLIHRRKEFKADALLLGKVLQAQKVKVHAPMVVSSFQGKDRLTAVRLESFDGKERYDLNVDGVFLEVGLTPNTSPIKGLVQTNENGEVLVNRDQSTSVKGVFAAGDVTDIEEKQLSIAVGQGALAALTAYKFLLKSRLIESKISDKESW